MASEHVVQAVEPIAISALHAYWKSSQTRLKCWFAGLRTTPSRGTATLPLYHRRQMVCLSREILVAELLTRVWSSVLLARDVFHGHDECQQLARHVFLGQMEARQEVLRMLEYPNRLPARQAVVVDRLRRRVERWTDVLVGPLVRKYDVTDFVFDVERARDFGTTQPPAALSTMNLAMSQLTLVGLSHAIPRSTHTDSTRATLDLAVARSVLSALPHDALRFHSPVLTPDSPADVQPPSATSTGLRFADLRRKLPRKQDHPEQGE